jgi:hypothetical protein
VGFLAIKTLAADMATVKRHMVPSTAYWIDLYHNAQLLFEFSYMLTPQLRTLPGVSAFLWLQSSDLPSISIVISLPSSSGTKLDLHFDIQAPVSSDVQIQSLSIGIWSIIVSINRPSHALEYILLLRQDALLTGVTVRTRKWGVADVMQFLFTNNPQVHCQL